MIAGAMVLNQVIAARQPAHRAQQEPPGNAVSFHGWFHVRSSRQPLAGRPCVAVAILTGFEPAGDMTNGLY